MESGGGESSRASATGHELLREASQSSLSLQLRMMRLDEDLNVRNLSMKDMTDAQQDNVIKEIMYSRITTQRSQLPHGLTDEQALLNLIKALIGTGVLSLPKAFANAGLWMGVVLLIILNTSNVYCLHLLIKRSHQLCMRAHRPANDYGKTVQYALHYGPTWLRKHATWIRHVINFLVIVFQLGICSIYLVFIADNVQQVFDSYIDISIYAYIAMNLVPLVPMCCIRNLKYLTFTSAVANVVYLVGFIITFQYTFQELPDSRQLPAVGKLSDIPLAFGNILFSFEAVCLVLPIENRMKSPVNYPTWNGVVNTASAVVSLLYIAVGMFGYIRFGADVRSSITLNLPDHMFYQSVKILIALSVLFTYPVQFYVPVRLLANRIEKSYPGSPRKQLFLEYLGRMGVMAVTFLFAELIPHLGLFISLLGSLIGAWLALIFPPLIDIICEYNGTGKDRHFLLKVVLNSLVMLIGIAGAFIGGTLAIINIVEAF